MDFTYLLRHYKLFSACVLSSNVYVKLKLYLFLFISFGKKLMGCEFPNNTYPICVICSLEPIMLLRDGLNLNILFGSYSMNKICKHIYFRN